MIADEPLPDDHQGGGQHRLDQCHHDPQLAAAVLPLAAEEQRLERGQRHSQRHADNGHRDGGGGPTVELRRQLEHVGDKRREPRRLCRDHHHYGHQHQRRRGGAAHGVVVASAEGGGDALGKGRDDPELHQAHVAGDGAQQQPHASRLFAEMADDEGEQDEAGRHVDGETGVVPERVAGQHGANLHAGGAAGARWIAHGLPPYHEPCGCPQRSDAARTTTRSSLRSSRHNRVRRMVRQLILRHRMAAAIVVATTAAVAVAASTTQPQSRPLEPLVFVSRQIPREGSIYAATARGLAGVGAFARLQIASPGSLLLRDAAGRSGPSSMGSGPPTARSISSM